MSPVYADVPGQLTKLSSGISKKYRFDDTYKKANVGKYDPAGDHVQGLAELGDRRLAVAQNGGFGNKGFLVISTNGKDVNSPGAPVFLNVSSKHPSGMQAAGSLIAVAESEPNRVEIIDARNPDKPVLLPKATKAIHSTDIPGTLSAVGLAYDREREQYWLLMAGASRSVLCESSTDSLTEDTGYAVGWACDSLNTAARRLLTGEGGTQLVFDADGRLFAMAYQSLPPNTKRPREAGAQVVQLAELSGLDGCAETEDCPVQTPRGSYLLRNAPTQADPGPNFRWGGTMRAGRSMAITSAARLLNSGPSRPYLVLLERYWD